MVEITDAINILQNHSYEEVYGVKEDDVTYWDVVFVIFCLVFITVTIIATGLFSFIL